MLVLTRDVVRPHVRRAAVAPITTTLRGLSTKVAVGPANGLDQDSVVSCADIVAVPADLVGRHVGLLLAAQESTLAEAIRLAFDLE